MKKIICLLLCITSIVCFCACDKDSSSSKADKSDAKQEESNSSNKIKDSTKDDEKDTEKKAEKKSEKSADKSAKTIELNKTVTIGDVMELTLESSEWVDEIKPSNVSSYYSYYEDKEGEKYFVVRGKAKNLAGEDLNIRYVNESEITINGKYKATVEIDAEKSDGTSFYGAIKPLQTLNIIAYASVSDDVYNICENTNLTLNILSDSEYIKEFYGKESPHETYSIEFDNK